MCKGWFWGIFFWSPRETVSWLKFDSSMRNLFLSLIIFWKNYWWRLKNSLYPQGPVFSFFLPFSINWWIFHFSFFLFYAFWDVCLLSETHLYKLYISALGGNGVNGSWGLICICQSKIPLYKFYISTLGGNGVNGSWGLIFLCQASQVFFPNGWI